jgi:hypothetical protein
VSLLYEKLGVLLRQRGEWTPKEFRYEVSTKFRVNSGDYRGILKELKKNGDITVSNQMITVKKH